MGRAGQPVRRPLRGIKAIELALAGRAGVELTSSAEACLGMVAMQRVDLCLLNAEHNYGPPPQVDGVALHRSVLARVNLHAWVAPGQQALAERLAAALKAALASGELQRVAGGNRDPDRRAGGSAQQRLGRLDAQGQRERLVVQHLLQEAPRVDVPRRGAGRR